jgi:excisionase family DNA binding protein
MEHMTTPAEIGPVMTVDEVAAAFRVDRSVIYKEVKAGRIEAMRVGPRRGAIRIKESAFHEYVAACATSAQAA